jgi:hypothetical protein
MAIFGVGMVMASLLILAVAFHSRIFPQRVAPAPLAPKGIVGSGSVWDKHGAPFDSTNTFRQVRVEVARQDGKPVTALVWVPNRSSVPAVPLPHALRDEARIAGSNSQAGEAANPRVVHSVASETHVPSGTRSPEPSLPTGERVRYRRGAWRLDPTAWVSWLADGRRP